MEDNPRPAEDVVEALRAAAAARPEQVVLLPGVDDAAMDAWTAPPPERLRAVFRQTAGFWLRDWSNDELDLFGPLHDMNRDAPEATGADRCGAAGTYRVVHTNAAAMTYYVDVDPQTGEWGRVFYFHREADAGLVASDLSTWLYKLAEVVRYAVGVAADGDNHVFAEAFSERFFEWGGRRKVDPVAAEEANEHLPPGIDGRCAGADALVADLRRVEYPTEIMFGAPGGDPRKGLLGPTYYRYDNGRFLVAVDLD
ncbi:hypothetical protein FZ103_10045 [Streptomonospora sp. PA3]|uniref:hypothetical protein n=1 Tax=Streptomonospora sp. PA3 TaxID=2607326 RepID=UPI0012DC8C1A|nr:hypothetical protein [Streptomonospora sp. PA3]MUL41512.1 hypothetical protein [Streptomonospora sp. PA3]